MAKTRNRYPHGAPVFKHKEKGNVVGVEFYGGSWVEVITADGSKWIAHVSRCQPLNADGHAMLAIAARP